MKKNYGERFCREIMETRSWIIGVGESFVENYDERLKRDIVERFGFLCGG